MGLIVTYCRHIRRYIRVTSNIPAICRGFSFAVMVNLYETLHKSSPSLDLCNVLILI